MNQFTVSGFAVAAPKQIGTSLCVTVVHKPYNGDPLYIDCYFDSPRDISTLTKFVKKGKNLNVAGELSVSVKSGKPYLKLSRARFWFVAGESKPESVASTKPEPPAQASDDDSEVTEADWLIDDDLTKF